MSKQREFFIYSSTRGWQVYLQRQERVLIDPIHVREVSPSRDALFEEMLGALKKYGPKNHNEWCVKGISEESNVHCDRCNTEKAIAKAEGEK